MSLTMGLLCDDAPSLSRIDSLVCLSFFRRRNANGAGGGGGKYLVLHKKSGKTLDLECADYIERDSVKRTLAKLRGEW